MEVLPIPPEMREDPKVGEAAPTDIETSQTNGEAPPSSNSQDGIVMRRTNSDQGSKLTVEDGPAVLPGSNSFPSLSDTVLRQLGALMEEVKQKDVAYNKEGGQNYEKDIENKFTSLMLAFKTDKLTLERRLELQMRLRDQAEANMNAELTRLKAAVELLSPLCTDSEKFELLEKVSEQVDALQKSTVRVSTSAEMHGAVQQENRLSRAVDIMLRHVENLKQAYDKEKTEHDETKKILTDNKISPIAAPKLESRSMTRARLASLPRKLSNTILEADSEEQSPAKDPPNCSSGSCSVPREASDSAHHPPAPTRALSRKPLTSDDRRVSSQSESEDESSSNQEPSNEHDALPPLETKFLSNSRRWSVQSLWRWKFTENWEWIGPTDELLVHFRMGVAGLLLAAALAVVAHSLLPYVHLGS